MVKKILVVKRETLFPDGAFEGFKENAEKNYVEVILKNHFYEERNDELENNPDLLQIIPYVWIVNPKTKQIFVYKRGRGKEYQEERHLDRYSAGVGGHIDYEENSTDPIQHSTMREFQEELVMESYPETTFVGYINDDSDMYNKVHFGVVGIAETEEDVQPTDDGIQSGSFYTIEEFEALFDDPNAEVENWTKLSWPNIKAHLQSKNSE